MKKIDDFNETLERVKANTQLVANDIIHLMALSREIGNEADENRPNMTRAEFFMLKTLIDNNKKFIKETWDNLNIMSSLDCVIPMEMKE